MKCYEGRRCNRIAEVTVDGIPLDPRLDLCKHSPTGFEWGYTGSGPAQLALAILADHFGDDERAKEHYQQFKRAVIAVLPYPSWTLTSAQIEQSLACLPA